MDGQNLWSYGSISPKTILILPKNVLDFRFDAVEKQTLVAIEVRVMLL